MSALPLRQSFRFAHREWSRERVLVIAELGTAHASSLKKGYALIDAAKASGADCVKFQHVYADEILHPRSGSVPLPGGSIDLYTRFKELEQPLSFFAQLKDYCARQDILFLCSPFGLRSAEELISLDPVGLKIASPELNYTELLLYAADSSLPLILSSGVSRLSDIAYAVELIREKKPDGELALLHCITSYPAPESEYNLSLLPLLSTLLNIPVGLSDHSKDPILVPTLAVAMGAAIVEKHLTLSRNDPGLDDPIALEAEDFARMVASLRKAEKEGGPETCRRLKRAYDETLIDSIWGNGCKALAPSEQANYYRTRRSIHARRALPKGTCIQREDLAILRTEKELRPGAEPRLLTCFIGRRTVQDISSGEGLRFEDIE